MKRAAVVHLLEKSLPLVLTRIIIDYVPEEEVLGQKWIIPGKDRLVFAWTPYAELCVFKYSESSLNVFTLNGVLLRRKVLEPDTLEQQFGSGNKPSVLHMVISPERIYLSMENAYRNIRVFDLRTLMEKHDLPDILHTLPRPNGLATHKGEIYASVNCPGASFLLFSENGEMREEWKDSAHAWNDVVVSQQGEIYLLNFTGECVFVMHRSGQLLRKWTICERCTWTKLNLTHNRVYVSNAWTRDHRVFTLDGRFLRKWHPPGRGITISPQGVIALYDRETSHMHIYHTDLV